LKDLVKNQCDTYLIDQNWLGTSEEAIFFIKTVVAGGCTSPVILLIESVNSELQNLIEASGVSGYLLIPHELSSDTLKLAIRYAHRYFGFLHQLQSDLLTVQGCLGDVWHRLNGRQP
jgi:AmiR/NasT family two-component response regulator